MFITVSLVLILIFLLAYTIKIKDGSYWKMRNVHFEKPLPFLGNIIDVIFFRKTFRDVLKELYFKIDQPFFGMWTFNEPQLVIKSPDLIRQILVKDFNYFQNRNIACKEEIDEFSANMMFCMRYPKWKAMRTDTAPVFSAIQIKHIYPEIQAAAKSMVEHINTLDGDVEVKTLCVQYTIEAVCSSVFGVDLHSFQNKIIGLPLNINLSFINEIQFMCYLCKDMLAEILKLKLLGSSITTKIKKFVLDILEKRKSFSNWKRISLLDILLKHTNKNTPRDIEIISISAEYVIAAYYSTSTITALVLYELCLNKSIQNKLRQEVMSNLDANGEIEYSALNTMNYLNKVILETLRKYPVLSILGRRCDKDYKIPNTAVTIEKGMNILIPLNALQHDPKYYPLPEVFDPERFAPENAKERHPYSYLPFGEGPRKCLGFKLAPTIIKSCVAHVIKNFEIELGQKTEIPIKLDLSNIFLMVDDKVYVKFNTVT